MQKKRKNKIKQQHCKTLRVSHYGEFFIIDLSRDFNESE